jgi:hypothetical protein
MSNVTREVHVEGEAPVNPYSLLGAVNASGQSVQRACLIFVTAWAYLMITVATVTHRDLLLSSDVTLPLLGVKLGLTRFFLIVPAVLLAAHAALLAQSVVLARKTLELDAALRMLEATDRRTHPLRLELGGFGLVQAIAGPQRSRVPGALVHGVCWFVLAGLPVVGLLFVQAAFLPYHDEAITWVHRVALAADLVLLALVGVFLVSREVSLGGALGRDWRGYPMRIAGASLGGAAAVALSLSVITIPGESFEHLGTAIAGGAQGPDKAGRTARAGSSERALFGLVARTLDVSDVELSANGGRINLRGRDLRNARLDRSTLRNADLTGANIEGASLAGADLREARLERAVISGADLSGARLDKADLTGAILRGANLARAALSGADLTGADLIGANLAKARLKGAALTAARLDGATLDGADRDIVGAGAGLILLRSAGADPADVAPPAPATGGLATGLRP